jgi:AcrR family transcriptional regulator
MCYLLIVARPKEFDRDKALSSALAVFRKNGFGATTTDDLRKAMGIGRQSFYDTFKGKKEIYLEALRKYSSDRILGFSENSRKSESPINALENILLSIGLESPKERALACLGIASICEFGNSDREVSSLNEASGVAMNLILEKLIREAKAKKQIRPSIDSKEAVRFLNTVLAGLRVSARAGTSPEMLKATAKFVIDGLMEH